MTDQRGRVLFGVHGELEAFSPPSEDADELRPWRGRSSELSSDLEVNSEW